MFGLARNLPRIRDDDPGPFKPLLRGDRLAGGDQRSAAEEAEDAAAPMAWLAAGSEVVALARRAAAAGEGRWTADDADPEASFDVLVTAAAAGKGSGWLEWEPHDGAGFRSR